MWKPDLTPDDQPKFSAIADRLEHDIRDGRVRPGERLPTHRELADALGINVSTVTRAYKEAERRRLIAATVGRGTYVSADACAALDLVRPEGLQLDLIEMGLVLPLYAEDEAVADSIERLSRQRSLQDYMRYADPAGFAEHRAAGAHWVKRLGVQVGPEQLLVMAGAQHALACSLLACFKPGDRIAVDALTYPGFKSTAAMLGIRLTAVAADDRGMLPDALETACRRDEIKGIYLMPGVQNPTCVHMPAARREALAELILRHGLLLLEDEAFGHTGVQQLAAVSALAPENSILICGLSKILYAGLRSAYVVASDRYRRLLSRAILNTIWMTPTLNAAIIAECITSGAVERMMAHKLREAVRRNLLAAQKLAGCRYRGLPAGYFVWMQLPQPWTGPDFEAACRERGVNLFNAAKFAVGGIAAPAAVRLSLTGPGTLAELERGLDLIVKLLDEDYHPCHPIM